MAIVFGFSSTATKARAVDVNRVHRIFAQEDLGAKWEKSWSAINDLLCNYSVMVATVSTLNLKMASAVAALSSLASAASNGAFTLTSGSVSMTFTAGANPAASVTAISNFSK